ncbi:MAG: hypothetical protein H6736_06790 [Alphaproteobacteria bacterium]|nr:hypothetical protein [Alphaproteobacteria bacterium]MCB9691502.1 hypothetical protein [Alphaproteobacteria bacterium]
MQPDVLEALGRVFEAPDSHETRLVVGDRLLELGDPRGELVQLQHAGGPPTRRAAWLLRKHRRTLLGPLERVAFHDAGFRLGFAHDVILRSSELYRLDRDGIDTSPYWSTVRRLGLARSARGWALAQDLPGLDEVRTLGNDALLDLLTGPTRAWTGLGLEGATLRDPFGEADAALLEALPELPRVLPSLRRLTVDPSGLREAQDLLPALDLRTLTVHTTWMDARLAALVPPGLERLVLSWPAWFGRSSWELELCGRTLLIRRHARLPDPPVALLRLLRVTHRHFPFTRVVIEDHAGWTAPPGRIAQLRLHHDLRECMGVREVSAPGWWTG